MKLNRSKFFDGCPVLYPFPKLLIDKGLSLSFKLRDLKFKKYLEILKTKRGAKIAEIGCGDGIFLKRVVNSYQVEGWGLDVSTYSIQRAKKQSPMNIKFESGLAENLPYKSNFFDLVMSFDTLEHINRQSKALTEMARVVKPGGKLLLYTINKNQKYTWNWLISKISIDIYKNYDHDPKLFLDPKWVVKELTDCGLTVLKVELYDAFFSLLIDEVIMLKVWLMRKLGVFSHYGRVEKILG